MAKKKPTLPSLITLNPITDWAALRQAFRDLLTHESLGDTAIWFRCYIDQDIHDSALCDCWSSLESEMRSIAKYSSHPEVFTLRELDCDIEEVVDALVAYNNNTWNFAPGGAPPRLRFDEVMERVKAVIWPQPPVKRVRKKRAA